MWVFTKHGFFSAVALGRGVASTASPIDPDRMMVRARVRGHLDGLKKRFPDLLGECEIQEFRGTDLTSKEAKMIKGGGSGAYTQPGRCQAI
jgi:hypothetical protein